MLNFLYKSVKKTKRGKGFTLVELIIVIAIIGVLAAVIIPTVGHFITDARVASANAVAYNIRKNVEAFMLDLNLQGKGMKRGNEINCQVMFMVDNYQWMCKAECKVKGKVDSDGSLTFNDYKNWWKQNATFVLTDDVTRYDSNHMLALCRAVCDVCTELRSGFIMAFFNDSVCKGVVFIPDCTYLWPGNYKDVDKSMTKNRPQKRPLLVHGRTDPLPRLTEFSPWNGVWPDAADLNFWEGQAGVDKDGFIVGTSPVIGLK